MRKTLLQCIFIMLLALTSIATKAVDTPIVTMTTQKTVNSNFTFMTSAAANGTIIKIDYGDGNKIEKTINVGISFVSGTIKSNTIKIYGAAESLTSLYSSSNELSSLDVSNCKALSTLNCSQNSLTELIPGNNKSLQFLDCSLNNITALQLNGYTSLTSLNCSNNELSELILSSTPKLTSLNCSYSKLNKLNIVACGELNNLSCQHNLLQSLNVDQNTKLSDFECGNNPLKRLNIDQNKSLTYLNIDSIQNIDVDLSNCTTLTDLHCRFCGLKQLKLTRSNNLKSLDCALNNLNTLEISSTKEFEAVLCNGNSLTFATLPVVKLLTYAPYECSQQSEIPIAHNISINKEVDLSKQNIVDNVVSIYTWKTATGTLKRGTDYEINNGVTTFLKWQEQAVYCEITNAKFPDLTLKTTKVIVDKSTGIGSIKKPNVAIYPNPVITQLKVKGETTIEKLQVMSATGAVVYNQTTNSTTTTVETGAFTPGIYILKLETEKGVVVRRFVKK